MDGIMLNLKINAGGCVSDVMYIFLLIEMRYGKDPWAWANRDDVIRRHFYLEKKNMRMIEEYAREYQTGLSEALNKLLDKQRVNVGKK